MVEVDISPNEAQAFIELLKDAKLPADMGYVLVSLKLKIARAFQEADKEVQLEHAKEILGLDEEEESDD